MMALHGTLVCDLVLVRSFQWCVLFMCLIKLYQSSCTVTNVYSSFLEQCLRTCRVTHSRFQLLHDPAPMIIFPDKELYMQSSLFGGDDGHRTL